mgnify:CR=1 FL=1
MSFASGLYGGVVSHRRFAPKVHALRYAIFQLLLDLDEADSLDRGLRHFARNRAALISFHDRDHGDGRADLKSYVMDVCAQAGIPDDGGKVLCLSMPRVLGQAFNPLTIYWRHDASGALRAMLYEVNNTFGQRHSYFCALDGFRPIGHADTIHAAKVFHVSPFQDVAGTYRFNFAISTTKFAIRIAYEKGGEGLDAAMRGDLHPLTSMGALRACLQSFGGGVRVLSLIYWNAVRLKLMGAKYRPVPAAPEQDVSR